MRKGSQPYKHQSENNSGQMKRFRRPWSSQEGETERRPVPLDGHEAGEGRWQVAEGCGVRDMLKAEAFQENSHAGFRGLARYLT